MRTAKIDCATLFHQELSRHLENSILHEGRILGSYKRITGILVGDGYRAHLDVLFSPEYFKRRPPRVLGKADWIRKEIDWHCSQVVDFKGLGNRCELCWIHPAEWELAQDHRMKKLSLVITEGVEWLRNNVAWLLERHWVGHSLGIKKWPQEWGQWGHGDIGNREFICELKREGHPQNWEIIDTDENKID